MMSRATVVHVSELCLSSVRSGGAVENGRINGILEVRVKAWVWDGIGTWFPCSTKRTLVVHRSLGFGEI